MRKFSLLALVVVLGWSSGASAIPIEWTVASGGNGHWYEMVTENPLLWNDAKVFAENRGGYLATLTSAAENSFVTSNLIASEQDCHCIWLGGFQNLASGNFSEPGGAWEWVTGEPWSYTNWNSGEPNNVYPQEDYLAIHAYDSHTPSPGYWNDHSDSLGFTKQLIEYDTNPIPEPNTALLLGIGLTALGMRRRAH